MLKNIDQCVLLHFVVPTELTPACQKLLEVAEGVAYLHRQNVVHGNLSGVRIVTAIICYPMTIFNDQANILVDQNAHALLSGFSLTGFANTEDDDSEFDAFTSNYAVDGSDANTEITQAQSLGPRTLASDVYAFAYVFLEVGYYFKLRLPTLTALVLLDLCWPKRHCE